MMLKAENLQSVGPTQELFSNLTFSVGASTCLMILGCNGAGKTTLLKTLVGLIPPDLGHVILDTKCIYIGHKPNFKSVLTPIENLQWWLGIQENTHDNDLTILNLMTILKTVDLHHFIHTPCAQLSAGQLQKLSLSRLLLLKAKLWILDEPLNSLDESGKQWFESILIRHLKNKGGAVVASHQALDLRSVTASSDVSSNTSSPGMHDEIHQPILWLGKRS